MVGFAMRGQYCAEHSVKVYALSSRVRAAEAATSIGVPIFKPEV
jgi:hypothetical protein